MPHESLGDPVIIDPYSVGAGDDDVCWLEDIIVGQDYKGQAIVESEVFCADADDLYAQPLVDMVEPTDYVEDDYADMGDYTGDMDHVYVEKPPKPTRPAGYPT